MLKSIRSWFHHLFNPHCDICKFNQLELEERKRDLVIDEYREMLSNARLEINRPTTALVELTKPSVVIKDEAATEAPRMIKPVVNSRQAYIRELEQKDAVHAAELRRKVLDDAAKLREVKIDEKTSELEESLGIKEA